MRALMYIFLIFLYYTHPHAYVIRGTLGLEFVFGSLILSARLHLVLFDCVIYYYFQSNYFSYGIVQAFEASSSAYACYFYCQRLYRHKGMLQVYGSLFIPRLLMRRYKTDNKLILLQIIYLLPPPSSINNIVIAYNDPWACFMSLAYCSLMLRLHLCRYKTDRIIDG